MTCGSLSASGVLSERRTFASAKNSEVESKRLVHSLLVMALSSMSLEGGPEGCVLRAICVLHGSTRPQLETAEHVWFRPDCSLWAGHAPSVIEGSGRLSMSKVLVLYYSAWGHVEKMAEA